MKLLVVTQYFWPENFRINDLVAELVSRGHEVTVLTGVPNYPDGVVFKDFARSKERFSLFAGAQIVRVPMLPRGKGGMRLVLNYLSFAGLASVVGPFKLRGRLFDAIFVYEPSPITVGIPAIVLKWFKKAPIVFWVLDLWPQSLEAVGAINSPFVLRAIGHLVALVYRGCDLVLAQSRSFISQIGSYLPDPARVAYFPSWSERIAPPEYAEAAPEVPARPDAFDIVFAGNIGEAQDFPAILNAAELLADAPVRWLIVGDGRKADWLRSEIARRGLGERMIMLGRFPLERMSSFFRHADALLVSLRAEPIFAMTIPGKLQSYLAAGIPVLAMLDGEGGDVVRTSKAGYAVAAGDAPGLADAVRKLMSAGPAERLEMGRLGRVYSTQEFDRNQLISKLESWLLDLSGANAKRRAGQ